MDVGVWNLLHDGCMVEVQGSVPGAVTVAVEIAYLRAMLPEPGDRFLVRLSGCTLFELRRDQTLVTDLALVATEEPEILSAQLQDQTVVVAMTSGAGAYLELHLRYERLSVSLEDGRPVSAEALGDAARRYWERFGRHR